MRTSVITATTTAILAVAAIALAAPAAAKDGPPGAPDQAGPAAETEQIVLRRDGDRAVPFDPVVGDGELVLRRDGSKAVPFVAEIGPESGSASSGFDRAVVVGGSALGLILLGAGTLLLVRRSRSTVEPRIPHAGTPTRSRIH